MFPNKYVELSMTKSGQPEQRHIIMFRESLQHREAVGIVYQCVKDHDLAMDVVSAGSVRLNHEGYQTYGNSVSLNLDHDKNVGPQLTRKLLEQGLDYIASVNDAIVVTYGLIDTMNRDNRAGSLNAKEDRTRPDVKLAYVIETTSGWFGKSGMSARALNNLERLLNSGNLD